MQIEWHTMQTLIRLLLILDAIFTQLDLSQYMHKVLVNRLGGLSLPRKSVVRLTDRPDMTLDVYRGRKTTKQQLFVPVV